MIIKYLFFIFLISFPFYFFESGLPQISHMILTIMFLIIIFKYYNEVFEIIFNFYFVFVFGVYIFAINSYWYIEFKNISFLIYSLYYFFGIITFFSIIILCKKNLIEKKLVLYAIFFSLFIQFLVSIFFFEINFSKRLLIYFNNPNQLGYYALSLANIFLIFHMNITKKERKDIKLYWLMYILVLMISLFLIVFSSSKASILSYVFLLFIVIYVDIIKNLTIQKFIYSLISLTILLMLIFIKADEIHDKFFDNNSIITRLVHIGQESDDSLSGRGYDRMLNHSQYLIFGAGEGEFKRFDSKHHGEIHSTLGNIIFSYGIIGLILFISILFKKAYSTSHIVLSILPTIMYSLTHNGIRSPLFWILLSLAVIYSNKEFLKNRKLLF